MRAWMNREQLQHLFTECITYFLFSSYMNQKLLESLHLDRRGKYHFEMNFPNITWSFISKEIGGRYFSKDLLNSLCKEPGKIYYHYKEVQDQSILKSAKNPKPSRSHQFSEVHGKLLKTFSLMLKLF